MDIDMDTDVDMDRVEGQSDARHPAWLKNASTHHSTARAAPLLQTKAEGLSASMLAGARTPTIPRWSPDHPSNQIARFKTNSILDRIQTSKELIAPLRLSRPSRDVWSSLPAEIRNDIYELVLLPDDDSETVDIHQRFPALTRVSKQTRAESMAVYLGTRNFCTTVHDCDTKNLLTWLKIARGFDENAKRNFRRLEIICTGNLVAVSDAHDIWLRCHRYRSQHSNFETWNLVVEGAKQAGCADKLVVKTLFYKHMNEFVEIRKQTNGLRPGDLGRAVAKIGEQPYLFSRYVLAPLLRTHGFRDIEAGPHDDFHLALQHPDMSNYTDRRLLQSMIVTAAMKCARPPEYWFDDWAAKAAAGSELQRLVYAESLRITRRRLQVRGAGLEGGHLGLQAYLNARAAPMEWRCPRCAAIQRAMEEGMEELLDEGFSFEKEVKEVKRPSWHAPDGAKDSDDESDED